MPEELFGKYREIIKMTAYDALKEVGGEDPRKAYKKQMIENQNQEMRGVYLQLQDGSVPSFEDFKAIKDKIDKSN